MQIADLFLFFLILVADELLHQLAGFVPKIVVARIHLHLVVIDIHDMGANRIQKVAVMADDDDGAGIIHQKFFQPVDGFNVQAVGGLVQQHDGRPAEQSLRQQYLHLLAAVQRRHGRGMQVHRNAQTVQKLVRLCLGLPAVHLGKFTLQLSGFFTVRVGKVLFRIQRFFFFHNVIQAAVAHDDGVHNIVLVVFEMVLLQNAHPVVRAHSHRAGGRLQRAGKDAQQRGLAGAVRSDDAIAVAGRKFQIDVFIQRAARELQADVGYS